MLALLLRAPQPCLFFFTHRLLAADLKQVMPVRLLVGSQVLEVVSEDVDQLELGDVIKRLNCDLRSGESVWSNCFSQWTWIRMQWVELERKEGSTTV